MKEETSAKKNDVTVNDQAGAAAPEKYKALRLENNAVVIPDLTITRESYNIKGTDFWAYRVAGKKHGKDVFVDFVAGTFSSGTGARRSTYRDREIYDQLNELYEHCEDLRLAILTTYDSQRGLYNTSFYFTGHDPEDGVDDVVPVNLQRGSDRAVLGDLLRRLSAKYDYDFPNVL